MEYVLNVEGLQVIVIVKGTQSVGSLSFFFSLRASLCDICCTLEICSCDEVTFLVTCYQVTFLLR